MSHIKFLNFKHSIDLKDIRRQRSNMFKELYENHSLQNSSKGGGGQINIHPIFSL